jgi:predicted nucleic acid-binding protein
VIVLDASAFLDTVDRRRAVIDRLAGEDIHAPHLIDVEVASALRRLVATGRIGEARARAALRVLQQADIRRHPHQPLLPVIWSLRDRVSAYDATYVALATALEATLVTTDRRLASVAGLPCAVEVP